MSSYTAEADYVRYQYADSEKLRIRAETHRLYSERPDDLLDWLLEHLGVASGDLVGRTWAASSRKRHDRSKERAGHARRPALGS